MYKKYIGIFFLIGFLFLECVGCHILSDSEQKPLFLRLSAGKTGINFSNEITYDRNLNVTNFPYLYNGGGVASGDINNDGLVDLYFTGNQVSSRLYLNKGNFEFQDITKLSGTATEGWASGVSMVDINHDGYLDIYVCITGTKNSKPEQRRNMLFINNGDSTFTKAAKDYGLADPGFSTQAVFFDYDLDGDLDMYITNNFPGSFSRDNRGRLRSEVSDGSSKSTDVLYRNNGNGSFTDVSRQAGIVKEGYSLGIAVSDINRDGWPDVFISNDVQTDDILYINDRDGTFTDKSEDYLKHTSYAGMGTDIADFNNDGWPDILQVDMLPASLKEKHQVTGGKSYDFFKKLHRMGYQYQYTQNSLQMNNGVDFRGNNIFSEIGRLAGIYATGWSWSGLFGDYDNDGSKDIMITNGYPKSINNYDYIMNISRSIKFGTDSSKKKKAYELIDRLKGYQLNNYFFKNNGDLTFSNVSKQWGFNNGSFSYGATQADLDNDGDLDIVISNLNDKAEILKNLTDSVNNKHYLTLQLNGDSLNTKGIGSKIILSINGKNQYKYLNPYRGYQSTTDTNIHFGLGDYDMIDSLRIIWPKGNCQLLTNVKADQRLKISYKDIDSCPSTAPKINQYMVSETDKRGLIYSHKENKFVDFDNQPLLPRMLSRLGPALAIGDVNNDNREDVFLGGATGQSGHLYIQKKNGRFTKSDSHQTWKNDKSYEDTGAAFFDANGDGWLDLYVVSGGNMYSPASSRLRDRLYLNTGNDTFIKAENMLPRMLTSGVTVKPADYDKDGDTDLFVGGRLIPGKYPKPPRSYILRNDGNKFVDVTADIAPDLIKPGLLTDAIWVDFDGDKDLDLVTTGVWMPVSFYQNNNGHFRNITTTTGLSQQNGWWQSIEKSDLDKDGDMDFVVGNLGLNNAYRTLGNPILHLFADNFDTNERLNAILAIKKEGQYYPINGLRVMSQQIPLLSRKIKSFEHYSKMSLQRLIADDLEKSSMHIKTNNFQSSIIMNNEGNSFGMTPLPNVAQISSINDIQVSDINGDNNQDLIVGGNIYNTNPEIAPNDAGNGLILLGDGKGDFSSVSPFISGMIAPANVRKLGLLYIQKDKYILIANNNDSLQIISIR